MEILTKAHLRMEEDKVLGLKNIRVEMFTKANTKITVKTEKEYSNFPMVQFTKDSIKMDGGMD